MNMINNYKIYDIENLDKNNTYKSTICNEYHYNNLGKDEYIVVIRKTPLCK